MTQLSKHVGTITSRRGPIAEPGHDKLNQMIVGPSFSSERLRSGPLWSISVRVLVYCHLQVCDSIVYQMFCHEHVAASCCQSTRSGNGSSTSMQILWRLQLECTRCLDSFRLCSSGYCCSRREEELAHHVTWNFTDKYFKLQTAFDSNSLQSYVIKTLQPSSALILIAVIQMIVL